MLGTGANTPIINWLQRFLVRERKKHSETLESESMRNTNVPEGGRSLNQQPRHLWRPPSPERTHR